MVDLSQKSLSSKTRVLWGGDSHIYVPGSRIAGPPPLDVWDPPPLPGGGHADSLVLLRKSKKKRAWKPACHCLVHVCTTRCCQMQYFDLFCCRPRMNGDTPPMGKQGLACRFLSFLEESQGNQRKSEHGSLHVTVW